MAYNMLKGDVLGSVDQHADQEIDGVKVFKNTVSASIFFDTDAQSPCITIKDVPIRTLEGGTHNSILTYEGNGTARSNYNLSFCSGTLKVDNVVSKTLAGNGEQLYRLPNNKFVDRIGSDFLKFGSGLCDVRGTLQVSAHEGIKCDEEGVALNFSSNSGITVKNNKVYVDPAKTERIDLSGQNVADLDLLLVSDVSSGVTKHTTLKNLYDNYIDTKTLHPAGSKGQIQFSDGKDLGASSALSFDPKTRKLNIEGKLDANVIIVDRSLVCHGAVHNNIRKVNEKTYEVEKDDYTILCETGNNKVTVVLPPACDNPGRILIVKKANSDKYKLKSHPVSIKSIEGAIDISEEMTMKMNYSCRTVQSDGDNWWVIGTKGS